MAFSLDQVNANSALEHIQDPRAGFEKGIFQDSLNPFIENNKSLLKSNPNSFTSTRICFPPPSLCSPSYIPISTKAIIILFDEFNVANHEFFAFKIFTESFYVKLRRIGAVNNFYQTAFVVDG